MEYLLKLLRPLFRRSYTHPYTVLILSILVAIFSGYYALHLKIDTDIANLLPSSNHAVQALNRLKETVGGGTALQVAIKSPSFEDNLAFAQALISRADTMVDGKTGEHFVERVEFHKNTEILKDNALYLATDQELDEITNYLKNRLREAKEKANPFYVDLGIGESSADQDTSKKDIGKFLNAYDQLIPKEYPISNDSTVMAVNFYPSGSSSNLAYIRRIYQRFRQLVSQMQPDRYNPHMIVKVGGRLDRNLYEINSIKKDVFSSFASGVGEVALLVLLYFFFKKYINYRMGSKKDQRHRLVSHIWRSPLPLLVIGVPLVISIAYTFGITYVVIGQLNTMTAVLFGILFGMGIDYGIHFYARYLEIRATGKNVYAAMMQTYDTMGTAIVTSALTTAASFYILMIARFRGFSDFGFISGSGIILALFCMMFILPAIVVLCERYGLILLNKKEKASLLERKPRRFPFSRTIIWVGLIVCVIVLIFSKNLSFQYNFGELEPKFPEYDAYSNFVSGIGNSEKRNPAYILADNPRDVVKIVHKLREHMKEDTLSPTILDVEALQERFPPTDSAAQAKLKRIAQIRSLLNDPFIKGQKGKALNKLRRAAHTTEPLPLSKIPDYLKERFMTKSGQVGNFIIIYPSVGLSNGRNSIAFEHDVGKVTLDNGKTFYAASTSIVAADMLQLMLGESPKMVVATFVLIVVLMYVSFRSVRWTLIALLPLIVGLLWTFGILMLIGLQFNFYNLVVLPAILGIGEDSGVHLAARYREEGRNSMWNVLSSTGQHISMGSVSTAFSFTSLLFTDHPGLISIGALAGIGVGMTLISALVFLPAMVQYLEDRNWISFDSGSSNVRENSKEEGKQAIVD